MWTNKLENPNSTWLSLRGTWLTNILIAMVLKVAFSILPGVTPEISWTLTNLTYNIVRMKFEAFLTSCFQLLFYNTPTYKTLILALSHAQSSFFFLHWLLGTPFDVNQNEYYALTLWEQLDDGTQYTPNRKFLTLFPIILYELKMVLF